VVKFVEVELDVVLLVVVVKVVVIHSTHPAQSSALSKHTPSTDIIDGFAMAVAKRLAQLSWQGNVVVTVTVTVVFVVVEELLVLLVLVVVVCGHCGQPLQYPL
jgi:hypothetical protein